MTNEEEKELIKGLTMSPDFWAAVDEAFNNVAGKEVDIREIGLWFFSQGYLSCLDYMENKDKFRCFRYGEIHD